MHAGPIVDFSEVPDSNLLLSVKQFSEMQHLLQRQLKMDCLYDVIVTRTTHSQMQNELMLSLADRFLADGGRLMLDGGRWMMGDG